MARNFVEVATLYRASVVSWQWIKALGSSETLLWVVQVEAVRRGWQPPPGFRAAVRAGAVRRAHELSRLAARRRLLVTASSGVANVLDAVKLCVPCSHGRTRSLTTFLVVNDSGQDCWVHLIEEADSVGRIAPRPGVHLARRQMPLLTDDVQPRLFTYPGQATSSEQGIFVDISTLSHAFAICLADGGRPIAVYQQRRAFLEMRTRHWRQSHVHALRLKPSLTGGGVAIEELACVQRLPLHPDDRSLLAHFQAAACLDNQNASSVVEAGHVPTPEGGLRPRFRSAPQPVKTYDKLADEIAGLPLPRTVAAWPTEARTIVNFVLGRDDTSYSHSPACPLDLTHLAARVEGQQLYESIWRDSDIAFAAGRSLLHHDDSHMMDASVRRTQKGDRALNTSLGDHTSPHYARRSPPVNMHRHLPSRSTNCRANIFSI